eukprot:CAMPEP_0119305396 /NCGR_PEP_ID=MMETSP1333-20130426/6410_1 /TAXON_ID=418940 /ORGANISM="Scyphosphaera apsteinii, Strain RCC1455" /LENGTH=500 /DNA_ID=CAMNT_0007308479 /DNA_START=187 /DNA_END=1689 /DNA_ORIENTATION=-
MNLLSGSNWCERRVFLISAEKDKAVQQAMSQLHEVLEVQKKTVEQLHAARKSVRLTKLALKSSKRHTLNERMSRPTEGLQEVALAAKAGIDSQFIDAEGDSTSVQPVSDGQGSDPHSRSATRASAALTAAARPSSLTYIATYRPLANFTLPLSPANIAVVVIAYNRHLYLDRALKSVFRSHPGGRQFPIYVSQDGPNEQVSEVVRRYGARPLIHPRKTLHFGPETPAFLKTTPGYAYLSVHYGWALATLFNDPAQYAGVIILEEDIEVAPDFFGYFTATAPLLAQDSSLLCISAFNDNGQPQYASDPAALYRSDFFPGLGWLLSRSLWQEIGPKWPNEHGFWDDWLREPPQRRGRTSIRPEMSRTSTFGQTGTSKSQFYTKYLARIQLGSIPVQWSARNVSFLIKSEYDAAFARQLAAAPIVSLHEAKKVGQAGAVRVLYANKKELAGFCSQLGIMDDLKAGVPRTAYRGVITLRINGRLVFLAPSYAVDQDITKALDKK